MLPVPGNLLRRIHYRGKGDLVPWHFAFVIAVPDDPDVNSFDDRVTIVVDNGKVEAYSYAYIGTWCEVVK